MAVRSQVNLEPRDSFTFLLEQRILWMFRIGQTGFRSAHEFEEKRTLRVRFSRIPIDYRERLIRKEGSQPECPSLN